MISQVHLRVSNKRLDYFYFFYKMIKLSLLVKLPKAQIFIEQSQIDNYIEETRNHYIRWFLVIQKCQKWIQWFHELVYSIITFVNKDWDIPYRFFSYFKNYYIYIYTFLFFFARSVSFQTNLFVSLDDLTAVTDSSWHTWNWDFWEKNPLLHTYWPQLVRLPKVTRHSFRVIMPFF